MKYLVIVLMLVCQVGWAEDRGFDATPPGLSSDDVLMRVQENSITLLVLEKRITDMEDTLDKIYSMVAEIKENKMNEVDKEFEKHGNIHGEELRKYREEQKKQSEDFKKLRINKKTDQIEKIK